MNKKFTILFDLDGTLVDTAPDLMRAHNFVMKKFVVLILIFASLTTKQIKYVCNTIREFYTGPYLQTR